MKPFEILADINFYLKGIGVDGKLREDRALLKAWARKVNGKWLLNSLNFNELLSFSNSNPHFSELKLADAGLDSMKSYERLEAFVVVAILWHFQTSMLTRTLISC